jgi:hypothetical protein
MTRWHRIPRTRTDRGRPRGAAGRLLHVLEKLGEADAEASCELRGGFHGRVAQAGLDTGDMRAIEDGTLRERVLRPLVTFTQMLHPPAYAHNWTLA